MEKRWLFNENIDSDAVRILAAELNLSPVLSSILVSRGMDSFDLAKDYFRPSLEHLHNPFLMKDMDLATQRIQKAFKQNECILVYGDYDVDGTTSVAMMYSFLSNYTENIAFYIPDRYKEGYGVSQQGVDFAIENEINLIISLDCGIKAVDKVAYAKENNIDFIICDHHLPGEKLPDAIVLDPKRADCEYPFKELSGCGVGFKLIQAMLQILEEDESLAYEYLDVLAVSIAADIVAMNGENRILAHFGLEKINTNPNVGIHHIIANHKNFGQMNIMDVVFGIAPKINAAGRMKSATYAVDLLLAKESHIATGLNTFISEENENRRVLDKQIAEEALAQIRNNNEENNATTVVFQDDWHKGVIGIVASRLIETYYRPTIVFTASGDQVTGSARSVKGYSIYDAIEACKEHLVQFGGHKYACGLTLNASQLSDFKLAFESYVDKTMPQELRIPAVNIDAEIGFAELKAESGEVFPKFYRVLKQFAPFGPQNMNPTFVARDVEALDLRLVGDNHLKLRLKQQMSGVVLEAIAFNFGHLQQEISMQPFHIAFHIEENNWNNKRTLQLNIKDIKIGQID